MTIWDVIYKILKPKKPVYDGKCWDVIKFGCPDCGSQQFHSGPTGGFSINVECAQCHNRFNVGVVKSMGLCERI